MAINTSKPALGKWREKEQKLEVFLDYTVNLGESGIHEILWGQRYALMNFSKHTQ